MPEITFARRGMPGDLVARIGVNGEGVQMMYLPIGQDSTTAQVGLDRTNTAGSSIAVGGTGWLVKCVAADLDPPEPIFVNASVRVDDPRTPIAFTWVREGVEGSGRLVAQAGG